MIIEHEDNPSWTVPAARTQAAQREAPPGVAAKMEQYRRDRPRPKRPSIAVYLILGMVMVAMLAPALIGMG